MAENGGIDQRGTPRRPAFGTPAGFHFIITVLVVSATTGMFLFLGSTVGDVFSTRKGTVMVAALIGAVGGVVAGSRLSMALTDTGRDREMWVGSVVGGLLGLAAGIGIPLMATPMRFAGVFALLAPGIGVAVGQTLARLMEVPEQAPSKPRPHGPYGEQRPYL